MLEHGVVSEEMNGCSALTEREKEMRKSGESTDTEGFIRKWPSPLAMV